MTHSGRFLKLPARPGANEQQTGERPAQRNAKAPGKAHVTSWQAAAPVNPILQARQDATAAEAEVAKISRAHLKTLLASPPRVRIAHFTDPELTPTDRTELEQSVRSVLPRSAPVRSTPSKLSGYRRQLLRAGGYKCAVATVLLAAAGLLAGVAWHNTGERMVGSNTTWIVDWRLPDGSVRHGAWKAGLPLIAMRPRGGKIVLRYWLNALGYATTEVDENWLLRNSFDYVVAPTGATGVVSPSNR